MAVSRHKRTSEEQIISDVRLLCKPSSDFCHRNPGFDHNHTCPLLDTPFSDLLFFVWAVYDVFKARQINTALGAVVTCPSEPANWVQCKHNPKMQFGFGQILPFCLFLSTILQLADIYSGNEIEP